jgi:hypothetical protein
MSGINAFEDHLKALIEHAKANKSINHMTDENKDPASWDSKLWIYTNDNLQSANLLFTAETHTGATLAFYKKATPLASPMREVGMLFALHIIGKDIGIASKRQYVAIARGILASVNCIEDLSHQLPNMQIKKKTAPYIKITNYFISFLNDSVFQHNPLRKLKKPVHAKTGDETEAAQKEKLPDEKCIAALGAILHDVIPLKKSIWKTEPLASQRDAFICTMAALAMGAPNRVAAEQTVLDRQRLQKHTEITNDKEEVVHYLNWKGSKGYKNNQNHILSVMSDCIDRCLDYMIKATEPMRVLARFYTDPSLPLRLILRKKDCDEKRWCRVDLDLNKPTNMVTLGYLLGLYDEGATVQVASDTEGAYKKNPNCRNSAWCKPVWAIQSGDVLKITHSSIGDFIGLKSTHQRGPLFNALGLSGLVPLIEAQKSWMSHIKNKYPGFPKMRNNTKNGVCDARTMLFALSGRQLGPGAGSDVAGTGSSFFPVNPATLGGVFIDGLGKSRIQGQSFFMRHGFSDEFSMCPHQFRHYINHTGFESGVPKLILNIWSGRQDPTQVLHYIHTSDADQASTVSDIMFNEGALDAEQAKTYIRPISQEEYNELTGTIASETSSGICTQALYITPCEFLNDFDTQCVLCEKSCHVAHDDQSMELLSKDLNHQLQRLEQVASSPQFTVSQASRDWYKVHRQQTGMLTQLLVLMNNKAIRQGSLIRLLSGKSEFRITDLKTQKVEIKQLCLPDVDKEIAQLISEKSNVDDHGNSIINELLELF